MSHNNAYIKAISHFFPEGSLTNDTLSAKFPEWSVEKISEKTGIYNRYIAAENMYTSDMGIIAAQRLFEEHNISPESIDFILFCTQSPDYFLPTTACIVQDKLGIPTTAGALDFNLGCSGYIYGLSLAKGLICAGVAKNILFITSEAYTKFIHPEDKSNRTIFGDAATASLITAEPGGARIGNFSLGTDGKGAENLIVKRGAVKYPKDETVADVKDEYGNVYNENNLYMNGREIFTFTSENVPALVRDTVAKNEMEMSGVDLYIFHQANRFMLDHLRKKLKITPEQFYIFMQDCGNTVSSTIPIALEHALGNNAIKQGDKVLLAGFGVGYSWGGVMLYY